MCSLFVAAPGMGSARLHTDGQSREVTRATQNEKRSSRRPHSGRTMTRRRGARSAGFTTAAVALLVAGCGTAAPSPSATTAELPQGDEPVSLDPAEFTVDIDNRYWPMSPGTRWTYREIDGEGNEVQVVVTVTTETRDIANGVTARVVRD